MAYPTTLPLPLSKAAACGADSPPDDFCDFSEIAERHERVVYHVALRVVRNREDAEDVAQEVWLRVARSLPSLRDQSRLLPWLCRITHNCAMNFLSTRRNRLQVPPSDDDPFAVLPGPASEEPEHQTILDADRSEMRSALMTLAERDRRILILREVEGLPYVEIGKVLNISTGNAEVAGFRARARLRQRLGTPALP